MGAIFKSIIRACRFYILLSSCSIALLATISVGVLNFGKFQGGGGLADFRGGLAPPSPRLATWLLVASRSWLITLYTVCSNNNNKF